MSLYSKKFELKFNGVRGFSELQVETSADHLSNLRFVITSGKRKFDSPGDKYDASVYDLTQSHSRSIHQQQLTLYFQGVPNHQYNHIRRMWEELSVHFPLLKTVRMPWDVKNSILTYLAIQEGCSFSIIESMDHTMNAYVPHRKGQYARKHIIRFRHQRPQQHLYTHNIVGTIIEFMITGWRESPQEYYLAHKDAYHAISGRKVINSGITEFYEWIIQNPPRESIWIGDDTPFDENTSSDDIKDSSDEDTY